MVAIDNDGVGFFPEDRIFGGLCPAEKFRLQSLYFHEHTQQRGDDVFPRENQN